jgi:hypothetical protein
MDDVKNRVIGLLPVVVEKRVTGEATVLQLFDIHLKAKQIMKVAGCRVMNGIVEKDKQARVVRDGEIIFAGMFRDRLFLRRWTLANSPHRPPGDPPSPEEGYDGGQEGIRMWTEYPWLL